jgi:YNFM family putative membrane transporter
MVGSSAAGELSDRLGRGPVLIADITIAGISLGLSLLRAVPGVICGIAVLTIGFFIGHSVASGWVGYVATGAKGNASSLHLLAYYLGSSIVGSIAAGSDRRDNGLPLRVSPPPCSPWPLLQLCGCSARVR